MGKKAVAFKPELSTPIGYNGYSGKTFRCFTKGDTLPFKFTIKNSDGTIPATIATWTVWVAFSDTLVDADNPAASDDLLEVEIPLTDEATGVFSGNVSDTESNSLPDGLCFATAKYVDAAGATRIIDMAQLEVYPNIILTSL